jgi:glutamyl/glutaminyl-tRNA synthetase
VTPGKTRSTTASTARSSFDNEHIENFVILRSDTHPTYHLYGGG